ncbi:hypothetical protein ACFC96_32255 [Streptomyces sp. NPDC055955]|uniref:hypothetical protein n=1 Tax=Streptomyces sp. NPDC055955 TaxID=3345665 RepID=UPI0035DE4EDA
MKNLGARTRATKHAALRDLGAELSGAVSCQLPGIGVTSVDRWKNGAILAEYAAEVARYSEAKA